LLFARRQVFVSPVRQYPCAGRMEHLDIHSAVHSQFDVRSPYVSQPLAYPFSLLWTVAA
jgi:hypothetical protein